MPKELAFTVTIKILTRLSLTKEHSPLPTSGHPPAKSTEIKWKTKKMLSHASLSPLSLFDKTKCIYTASSKKKKNHNPTFNLISGLQKIPRKKNQKTKTKILPMTYCQLCNSLMATKKSRPSGHWLLTQPSLVSHKKTLSLEDVIGEQLL